MVTVKDIAREAGVSIGTVDRVIHERGRFSAATAERVRQAMARLGYKPNVFARNLSLAKRYTVGVLMPRTDQDYGYWQMALEGIDRAQREMDAFPIDVRCYHYNRYSAHSFKCQVSRMLRDEVDGVLCAPVLTQLGTECLAPVAERIPWVLFDADLPEVASLTFIGQDAYRGGRLCGKLMSLLVSPGECVLALTFENVDLHIKQRRAGFVDFISDRCNVTLAEWPAKMSDTKRRALLEDHFVGAAAPAGVFVPDAALDHVARFLESKGKRPALIGYDLTPSHRAFLEQGVIDFLINQKPAQQTYRGLQALYRRLVLKEDVTERKVLLPLDIVTAENADYCEND